MTSVSLVQTKSFSHMLLTFKHLPSLWKLNNSRYRIFYSTLISDSNDYNHVVVGSGIVGLAVASTLSETGRVLVLDRNRKICEETSSRNSEVIHGGMYYPIDSNKTLHAIQGRKMLYNLCSQFDIPHRKVGKWIFATDYSKAHPDIYTSLHQSQSNYLHMLFAKCKQLEIPARWVDQGEICKKEPNLSAFLALESPETGIIDSHSLANYFLFKIQANGGHVSLKTELMDATPIPANGFQLLLKSEQSNLVTLRSSTIINCGGLNAHVVAQRIMKTHKYKLFHAIGHYYSYSGNSLVSRLTYPIPDKDLASLGIHTVIDMGGRMRLGPDIEYLETTSEYPDYTFRDTQERRRRFFDTVKSYLPNLDESKLKPDFTGIRPKIAEEGAGFRDFVIQHEADFPGLINLIGIESPGLTSCLSIAKQVKEMLQ